MTDPECSLSLELPEMEKPVKAPAAVSRYLAFKSYI
jgi:hypothetical protein